MTLVTIGIASRGRPELARTLQSLDALVRPEGVSVAVIVADDSPDGAAARVAAEAPLAQWPLRVVPVAAGNISIARNACLEAAEGEWLAFIDDDEWAEPDWLARLLAAAQEFGADAVFGPVFPRYPDGTPDWFVRADPLYADWTAKGGRGARVTTGRCGNTLFRMSVVHTIDLRFDPAFGRTGAEDTEFFRAFGAAGGRMVLTHDARVHEDAPPARATVDYVRRRSAWVGQAVARHTGVERGRAPGTGFYLDALARCSLFGTAAAALRPFDRARSLRLARRGWIHRGKLREPLGLPLPQLW